MKTTWVLVAQRAGARLYEKASEGEVRLLEEIAHPEGRLRDHEVDTDRQGATFHSGSSARHAFGREESAHEHDAASFARTLARRLSLGRHSGRYDELMLVAEPHFLGVLRAALDRPTALCVTGTMPKDYAWVVEHDLRKQVEAMFPEEA